MISIVMPVYNVEKYLRKCLDSILNQTYQDFEIICVDDGSSDKSLEILEEYAKKDSRFVILKENHLGAGEARNRGMEFAKGKYIQFLDSDDYFEPDMLEELYNRAEKYQADLTVCSARKVDRDGNITESGNPIWPLNLDKVPLDRPFSPEEFPEDIFGLFCVVPWNKLYLRELIIKNNLKFQNLASSNDLGFSHIARVCAKHIVVFNKELINYRYNREGSIAAHRAENSSDILSAAIFVRDFLKKHDLYDKYKNAYVKAFINHIRAGISISNENQQRILYEKLKELMPEDIQMFRAAFVKTYITKQYLENVIGNKKVMLWGASVFIRQVLESETAKNPNILGIVDRNVKLQGQTCGGYKIYPPESIKELKPDGVILTVLSNNEEIYESMAKSFPLEYPQVKLLPNIFTEKVDIEKLSDNITSEELEKMYNAADTGFTYIKSNEEDIKVFEELDNAYKAYSEMSEQDRLFLSTLVTRYKPKKLLELGVSKGASSIIMLNAIKDIEGAALSSVDYNEWHYRIKDKKTGFYVDNYPELKKKWTLKTGGMALNFLEELSGGEKFDFCFIDTVHSVPGEILDVLQVLPYLKQDAIVVLHDTNLQIGSVEISKKSRAYVNNLLMSTIRGEKLIPYIKPYKSSYGYFFNNIGAVKLSGEKFVYELFNLLAIKWSYIPEDKDLELLVDFWGRHYGKYYAKYFENVIKIQNLMAGRLI